MPESLLSTNPKEISQQWQSIKRISKPMRSSKVAVEQSGSLKIPQH